MEMPKPQAEHHWLHRLIGEWTAEMRCNMGPDQPPMVSTGREIVRSLGGLWTIGEGTGEVPGSGGAMSYSIMTLGYDPASKQFVGSFIASVMTHLWVYHGTLDATSRVLTLDTEGPGFTGEGPLVKYQDIIEFVTDDHRTLSSQTLGPDGKWVRFMEAHYHRVK